MRGIVPRAGPGDAGLPPRSPVPPLRPPRPLRFVPSPSPLAFHAPFGDIVTMPPPAARLTAAVPRLPRRPQHHPGVRRRHRRALLLPAPQQPPQRRRRDPPAQSHLRHRARRPGRGPPRPRTLHRPAAASRKVSQGPETRARRDRGQARRRRRMADRRQRPGEQILGHVPPRARHQHPRLRAARRGLPGQARQAGDLPAGRFRPGL